MKKWTILMAVLLATGCSTPKTTYDWGRHDQDLFNLMKDPGKLEAYGLSLRQIIDSHPDGKRLPPGICAEYGYILISAGRLGEALPYFELEKKFWPESTHIMDRMIANCHPKPAVSTEKTATVNALSGSSIAQKEVL